MTVVAGKSTKMKMMYDLCAFKVAANMSILVV